MSLPEEFAQEVLEKYRVYLEADSMSEAEDEAPEDVEVQEGEQGGFYYNKEPGTDRGQDDSTSSGEGLLDGDGEIPSDAELGPDEELSSEKVTGPSDLEEGDVISYTPFPDAESRYGRVAQTWIGDVELENGVFVSYRQVAGKVQEEDPTGDWEVDSEFGETVAAAVEGNYFGNTHHEEQYVNVRNVQHNLSEIDNVDLLKEALRQEIDGRNSRALRRQIPSRIRALGGDPDTVLGVQEDEVPEVREGTEFETFSSGDAIDAGAAIVGRRGTDEHFEEWNGFLDHLTQAELKEAAIKGAKQESNVDSWQLPDGVMDWENGVEGLDGDVEFVERDFGGGKRLGHAALTSRMTAETARETVKAAREEYGGIDEVPEKLQSAMVGWAQDAEFRREYFEEIEGEAVAVNSRSVERQFYEDFDEYTEALFGAWTGSSSGRVRSMAQGMFGNTPENTLIYAEGYPVSDIEPTEEVRRHFQRIHNETKRHHRRDGSLEVFRGVEGDVSTHGTLDSYATDRSVAEDFNYGRLIDAEVDPEDIFASKAAAKANGYDDFPGFGDEEEVIVIGGAFDDTTGGEQ